MTYGMTLKRPKSNEMYGYQKITLPLKQWSIPAHLVVVGRENLQVDQNLNGNLNISAFKLERMDIKSILAKSNEVAARQVKCCPIGKNPDAGHLGIKWP